MSRAELAQYNCSDADVTYRVYEEQVKELLTEPPELRETFNEVCKAVRVIGDMQLRGTRIDVKRLNETIEDYREYVDKIYDAFLRKGINVNSPIQLKEFLARNVKIFVKNTQKVELQKYDDNPIVELILRYREKAKLLSTFLEPFKGERIYTTYNLTGTITGRLSSENPNLQNIPKDVRHIFLPSEDEYFVEADYSQFELMIYATLVHDDDMLSDLTSGLRIHDKVANRIYGDREKTHREMKITKTVVFGTMYGRTPRSVALALQIPIYEAEKHQRALFDVYPSIKRYQERMGSKSEVRTVFGRKKINVGKATEMYNFPIQSTAADILIRTLNILHEEGFKLALTVHDSIVFESNSPKEDGKRAREILTRPIPELEGRSFPCKVEYGKNWRDLKKLED